MIYIVFYTYIFDDNEEAPRETLGVFSDEGSAYKCAIQKYCQEIQTSWKYEEEGLKNTLEENLLGTPEEAYYNLHSWRDEVFASEYAKDGDSVGPMVFVQSMKISKTWNLDGYLKKSSSRNRALYSREAKDATACLHKLVVASCWQQNQCAKSKKNIWLLNIFV